MDPFLFNRQLVDNHEFVEAVISILMCMFVNHVILLQSLSGHSSGIDSVSFDSSEVLVAAGAASGTIKLWDLEEAKSMFVV